MVSLFMGKLHNGLLAARTREHTRESNGANAASMGGGQAQPCHLLSFNYTCVTFDLLARTDLRAERTRPASSELSHKLSSAFMAVSCCSFCHRNKHLQHCAHFFEFIPSKDLYLVYGSGSMSPVTEAEFFIVSVTSKAI